MLAKTWRPRATEEADVAATAGVEVLTATTGALWAVVDDAGVGAAKRRINAANSVVVDAKSAERLPVLGDTAVSGVWSSGISVNRQVGSVSRSLGNNSLVMPCSTL